MLADFQQDLLPPEKACELLAAGWDSSLLQDVMLAIKPKVFATFEHDEPAPRDDATALSRALALLFWERARTKEEILFELSYPTDSVADPRFPTVAEAGWSSLFQPAEEQIPDPGSPRTCCGWTRPLGPHLAQPEIVHDNAPRALDQEEPVHILLTQVPPFPSDLCEAIDQELQAQGAQPLFDTWASQNH